MSQPSLCHLKRFRKTSISSKRSSSPNTMSWKRNTRPRRKKPASHNKDSSILLETEKALKTGYLNSKRTLITLKTNRNL